MNAQTVPMQPRLNAHLPTISLNARVAGVIHTLIASIFLAVAFLELGLAFDLLFTGRPGVLGGLLLLGVIASLYVVSKLREKAIAYYRISPTCERIEPLWVPQMKPVNSLSARLIDHA